MKDGSDAVADWPILNAMINAVRRCKLGFCSPRWWRWYGIFIHAGMVIVADGTEAAAKRIERVLTTDPGMGIVRHVDAGYDLAEKTAKEKGVNIPMMK